ncbi:MAG: DUF3305 domain-containing protein [Gammaproteobacteria bacterium]|nr:DUF3305 domain-containing protein [Gammaproteobacteria bacterium]
MQRRAVISKPWLSHLWKVGGIVVNSQLNPETRQGVPVRSDSEGEDYLWSGLKVRLHKDEVESYYYNLLSPNPSLFVVTVVNEQGMAEPYQVTASFDEASAHIETEGDVEALAMPPELYQWIERFVIAHYAPAPRTKRKRLDWSEDHGH